MQARVVLAPGVPDLAALGAEGAVDVLGVENGQLLEEPRAELLEEGPGERLLRCPLPGTPGEEGGLTGAPRGAGTGHVHLRRYSRAGLGEILRSRLGHPRSASLAEREWNLFCKLRDGGVSTPELLAVVAQASPAPWSSRSAIVLREADPLALLPDWLAEARGRRRAIGLGAVGHALARVARTGVELPELRASHIGLAEAPADDCISETVQLLRAGTRSRMRSTPEVLVTDVRGGRLGRPDPAGVRQLLERVEVGLELDRRDRLRLWRAALGSEALRAACKASPAG